MLTLAIPDYHWKALCTNLGVDAKILSEMQLNYEEHSIKMKKCLDIFATQESACWEAVLLAVCDSPFHNQELAKKISETHNISWVPFEHICSARLQ